MIKGLVAYLRDWATPLHGLVMVLSIFPLITIFLFQADNHDFSRLPSLPSAELEHRIENMNQAEFAVPGERPSDYFKLVNESNFLFAEAQKFRAEHGPELMSDQRLVAIRGFLPLQSAVLQEGYRAKFGDQRMMDAAAQAGQQFLDPTASLTPLKKESGALIQVASLWTWLVSGLFAAAFLKCRVKDVGLNLWRELCNPKFYLAAVFWPVGVFKYPRYVSPAEQLRRMVRFIGGILATSLSFAAVAEGAWAAERKSGGDGSDGSNEFVLRAIPMPTATVLTVGIEDNKILSNGVLGHPGAVSTYDVNVSFKALSFDLSGTHALAGSSDSDEVDYGVSLVGKPFRQWAPTATVAASMYYYDIAPEGTSRGGDILAPSISVSQPIGRGFTASVEVDGDLTRNTPSGLNGIAVLATVGCSTNVGHVRLDHSLQAIYANGPFGHDAGLLGRFEERASLPLTRHTTLNAFFRAFGSLIGARDRGGSHISVGLGLSQAF